MNASFDLRSIRALAPESLRGIKPAEIAGPPPRFEWVDPCEIYVEEQYQRDVVESGIALIRRIYSGFDWAKFKPPVCIMHPEAGVLVCIDGQHTAIACATHPGIKTIPVMIVTAADLKSRAGAFVGQNRERVALTPMAIYRGELVAGDVHALAVERACRVAGVSVLDNSINLRDKHPVGSTIAIGTMTSIARKLGSDVLADVLKVLVAAKRGPIKAGEISAVCLILDRMPSLSRDNLAVTIASKSTEAWDAIARAETVGTSIKIQDAIASVWCRSMSIHLPAKQPKKVELKPRVAPAAKAPAAPKPAPAPKTPAGPEKKPWGRTKPKAVPVKQTPAPVKPPAPPVKPKTPDDKMIRFNGVVLDPGTGELRHRGETIRLPRPEESVPMMQALGRVMPGMMDHLRLANVVFGKHADSPVWLGQLIDDVNAAMARARLRIRKIPKVGDILEDLGPGDGG